MRNLQEYSEIDTINQPQSDIINDIVSQEKYEKCPRFFAWLHYNQEQRGNMKHTNNECQKLSNTE